MYRLFLFLRRIYVLLLFLLLEGFAIYFYAYSSTYTKARIFTASNEVVGGIYKGLSGISDFYNLRKTNRLLETRVEDLENELAAYREHFSEEELAQIGLESEYRAGDYVVARVVRNTVNRRENFITVNKGRADGVEKGMAVLSLDGYMVGYVESSSENNSICVSVLNTGFRASGRVVGTDQFGSVSWPGESIRHVKLSEVPKYAEIARGDSVVTTHYSFYFPEGVFIGTIENFAVDESTASYNIDVLLGVDISALRVVMLVRNPEAYERIRLEEEVTGTVNQ